MTKKEITSHLRTYGVPRAEALCDDLVNYLSCVLSDPSAGRRVTKRMAASLVRSVYADRGFYGRQDEHWEITVFLADTRMYEMWVSIDELKTSESPHLSPL